MVRGPDLSDPAGRQHRHRARQPVGTPPVRRLGTVERGHADVTRTVDRAGGRFSDRAPVTRHDVVHVDRDLAVTVGIERGDVRVGGGELQSMLLRVTHVLRRFDGEWRLVHRHADHPPPDPRRWVTQPVEDDPLPPRAV